MRSKNLNKKLIILKVLAFILCGLIAVISVMQICFLAADSIECWRPTYEKLSKDEMLGLLSADEKDYDTLYMQTGLTQAGIDRMLSRGNSGINRILEIQDCLFKEHKVLNHLFAPFICTDRIKDKVSLSYLENGDILVTSSTHVWGLRMGHAALVVNEVYGDVLQAQAYNSTSNIERGGASYFAERVNFMILSPKVDKETKTKVINNAKLNLIGYPYSIAAGVFTDKNKLTKTQCAHIVWYAYNQFGIDLDATGGPVVTPRDLANSPLVEVIQVFGFDLNKMWK